MRRTREGGHCFVSPFVFFRETRLDRLIRADLLYHDLTKTTM